jgi:predicted DNA-binding transcriptional regulator AlpA
MPLQRLGSRRFRGFLLPLFCALKLALFLQKKVVMSKQQQNKKPDAAASYLPDALRNFNLLPDSAHVRQPVVKALWAISDATLWRRVKDGGIPQPLKLSTRVTAWNVGDLRRALNALKGN